MKTIISTLVLAILAVVIAGTPAQAGVIMLLTQDSWEGGSGQVGGPDDGFISWLQSPAGGGYTVIKRVVSSAISAATLTTEAQSQNVQLIIIGPRNTSGNYTDQAINQIAIPMISLLPHGIRNNADRLDWLPGQQGSDNQPWTTETIVRPTHPWVAGLSSTWFTYPTGSGDTRWTLAVETDTTNHLVGNGQVIALLNTTPGPTVGLVYWDKGVKAYDASTDGVFGEKRAWFGGTDWARFTPTSYQCSFDNYTADGKEVLRRMISSMVPEPATLTLLGLGVGGLLLRRRRG